jgi:2-amino-4-hydroxy-6-hydroxymethyldihydropteridine diphosphokinase
MRVVVGLGANLGDRLETMRSAVRRLRSLAELEATSRVYRSAPVGGPPQPEFLNAAALLRFDGDPLSLLRSVVEVEEHLGRVRGERWGPRVIDLDILWIEGLVIESPELVVPHPRLHERAFALLPLLELVPGASHPRTGERFCVPAGDVEATGERL